MKLSFDDQVAIVTGAGSGIGRAIAVELARRHARVVVNDLNAGSAQRVEREIQREGGQAVMETTPVASGRAAEQITECALQQFGRIDVLVNNAGISCPGDFADLDDQKIAQVLDVDLLGPYALMRAVWPCMRQQTYGRILNLCSSAALGSGISGPYAVAKAGLIGLTKEAGIAGESLGIKVNALLPTAYTSLITNHPDSKYREWLQQHFPAERVAAAAIYLISRDVHRSGELYAAGGGRVARIGFIEANGYFGAELTPETVREQFDTINDLKDGAILSRQIDHQRLDMQQFPFSSSEI